MRGNKLLLILFSLFLCLSQTVYGGKSDPKNWTDGGSDFNTTVYDVSWYQDSESEFTIKSNNQLGGLAKKVNADKVTFEGKTINLGADVDMSLYNWVSINGFKGTFNGNGHVINFLKTNNTSNGLFATLDAGEVKNVLVSGEAKGAAEVGGIVGLLSGEGKITNVGYTGRVEATAAEAHMGGIAGKNEGGTISNCYFFGDAAFVEEATVGGIVGSSTGTVTDSYFLPNDTLSVGIGEGTGTNVEAKQAEAFASGEVSWLLNQLSDAHTGAWGKGGEYPLLVSAKNKPVYKVTYPKSEYGTVKGDLYASEGATVYLTKKAVAGYTCTDLTIADVDLTNDAFVMPAKDVTIEGSFVQTPVITTPTFDLFKVLSGKSVEQSFEMQGTNIVDGEVSFILSGSSDFTARAEDGKVVITYAPTSVGAADATLTLSLKYAKDVVVALTGNSVTAAPVAKAATDIESASFVAKWAAVGLTTDYLLTVAEAGGAVLEGYDALPVGKELSYKVTNLKPETQYTYSVQSKSGEVVSLSSQDINVTTLSGTSINYSAIGEFKVFVDREKTQAVTLSGAGLSGKIMVALEGSSFFTVDKDNVNSGEEISIVYKPTEAGAHTATMTLTSAGAENTVITLSGISSPINISLDPPTNVTATSFTLGWAAVDGATDYLVTVEEGGKILDAYRARSTEGATSITIQGLNPETEYVSSIQVVHDQIPSDLIAFVVQRTGKLQPVATSVEKYSFIANWDQVAKADNYLVTLTKDGEVVNGYDGIPTTDTSFLFKGLVPGTEYTCNVTIVAGQVKQESLPALAVTTIDYGKQLDNSGFELWEDIAYNNKTSREPLGWNSFISAQGGLAGTAATEHMEVSREVRPGSTGKFSTRIWTSQVVGVNANGNLTTGRINAASTTATSPDNHNITLTENPEFNQPLNGSRPDSLTIWVKYKPTTKTDQARIAAIIHDTYDFRDPSDSDPDALNHVVATAAVDYLATDDKNWQRITIPFDYSGPAESSDYMLVTFTSNKTPGKGSAHDMVYLDDLLLIYNPTLTIGETDKAIYRQGEAISVAYTLEGTMSPSNSLADANVVSLQLSDAEGLFENAVTLAEVTTDYSGTLTAQLPADLQGDYQVRIVTTNYPMISETKAISVRAAAKMESSSLENFTTVAGTSVKQTITVTATDVDSGITVNLQPGVFTADKLQLPKEGGDIVVTYLSGTAGLHAITMTLTADDVEDIVFDLKGSSTPVAVKALEADNETDYTFDAMWEASVGAIDYLLTVKKNGEVVDGYNELSTGDAVSYPVSGLAPNTEYTYTVKAVSDYFVSEDSNEILAKTTNLVGIDTENTSALSVYPSPATDYITVSGISENGVYRICNVAGHVVNTGTLVSNRIDVSTLVSGVYFIEAAGGVKAKFIKK